MSNFLAIATVTAVLKREVLHAAQSAINNASVTTTRPKGSTSGNAPDGPYVNIYLYQVTPNPAFRNQDLPQRHHGGEPATRPQIALDLHYLLSFYGDDGQLEPHRLLGSIASHLDARPVLTNTLIEQALVDPQFSAYLSPSDLQQQQEKIKLTPVALSFEELARLWTSLFQGPHALSIAYNASVVLIEAEVKPALALPVQSVGVHVRTMTTLRITAVGSSDGHGVPIRASSTLVVQGYGFHEETIEVHIDGAVAEIQDRSAGRFALSLQDYPAGAHTIQVVQPWLPGNPPIQHTGVGQSSNLATFVLQPSIEAAPTYANSTVSINIRPAVGPSQSMILLLVKVAPDAGVPLRFEAPTRADEQTDIDIPVIDIEGGDYLVRVLVDGVPNEWSSDAPGGSLNKVTIP